MPSSLLFAGLVATWLLVLVPMAARRRRPMTRPSDAALSSRVLVRPVRARPRSSRTEEVSSTVSQPADQADPGSRYRPGRGGYDPEAAALAAQARCTFRQRAVLVLVLLAVITALVAAALKVPGVWWPHGGVDLLLVGYLVNLRRQVRTEQAIRGRRAARLAGSRPAQGAGRGRDRPEPLDQPRSAAPDGADPAAPARDPDGRDGPDLPDLPAEVDDVPALPPLSPVPLPPRPAGTVALELDDEDPELHELDPGHRWGYRRAAGQ